MSKKVLRDGKSDHKAGIPTRTVHDDHFSGYDSVHGECSEAGVLWSSSAMEG
jgi:hypothetical protein